MAARLYLIRSEERSGLVKIGSTSHRDNLPDDLAVMVRVSEYSTGISHSSKVVQMPGASIFERWLQHFLHQYQKTVVVRFLPWDDRNIKPREWFELPGNLAEILTDAFTAEPPQAVEEVESADLPAFFAGAMTAIRWHTSRESPEALAESEAWADAQDLYDARSDISTAVPHPVQGGFAPVSPENTIAAPIIQSGAPRGFQMARDELLHAPVESPELRLQMERLQQTETIRTYIALVAALLTAIIWLFGAPGGAALFAILCLALLAFWPNVLPRAAAWVVFHIGRDAAAMRARNARSAGDE